MKTRKHQHNIMEYNEDNKQTTKDPSKHQVNTINITNNKGYSIGCFVIKYKMVVSSLYHHDEIITSHTLIITKTTTTDNNNNNDDDGGRDDDYY